MDVNNFNASETSPLDEGELKECDVVQPKKVTDTDSSAKAKRTFEDTEAQLRKKLLEKQQQKDILRVRRASDEEEMFAMQPGYQESKKKEVLLKAQREKFREDEARERQLSKERARALRKPIEWPREKDDDRHGSSSKRSSKETSKKPFSDPAEFKKHAKRTHSSNPISLPSSQSHGHRRSSPIKRKVDDYKDDSKRSEKSSRRDIESPRESSYRHHSSSVSSSRATTPKMAQGDKPKVAQGDKPKVAQGDKPRVGDKAKVAQGDKTTSDSSTKLRLAKVSSPSEDGSPTNSPLKTESKKTERNRLTKTASEREQLAAKKPKTVEVIETTTTTVISVSQQVEVETCSDVSTHSSPLGMDHKLETVTSTKNSAESGENDYKKYSRFESSPEMDDFSDDEEEFVDEDLLVDQPPDIEMTNEEDSLNLSELERKNFNELTEEDKARLTPETLKRMEDNYQRKLTSMLPVYYPGIAGCRNVAEFENLNRIEEGTFGVVFRAVEKKTDEVVALKRLKMENEHAGFPITSLREINMLLKCGEHPNIVNLREIVVGSNIDRIYLVMEYVDHDMKALMETMSKKSKKFTTGQVKTLLRQLLSGVKHLHEEYVIHRDLKTSNLLLTRNGILKIGDFGLAREFGDPLKPYTPVVVTLWYRSPELLLGVKEYSTAVDMWSVGCIFGEFLKFKPLFPGKGEVDQLNKIFSEIGTPTDKIWPGYGELPGVKKFAFVDSPYNQLKKKFVSELSTDSGFELFNRLLAPCPFRRISAEKALQSGWFAEDPLPTDPSLFPTWPSKSDSLYKDKTKFEPTTAADTSVAPVNASRLKLLEDLKVDAKHANSDGFSLKFDVNKF